MGARGRDVIRADRRWEIAAAMVFVPTADVGEGTRDAARAEGSCGRWHSRCGAPRPERSEAAPGMLPAPSSAWPASTGAMPDWTYVEQWAVDLSVAVLLRDVRT